MFESDDFDEVLSQFNFPGLPNIVEENNTITNEHSKNKTKSPHYVNTDNPPLLGINEGIEITSNNVISQRTQSSVIENTYKMPEVLSPKHAKRKMINSFFDTNSKRKFPGPAGLLTGTLEESTDENICQMELLSQDIDFSQNHLRDVFASPLWERLQQDVHSWDLGTVDSVKTIKQQALAGHLRRRKAQVVTAFVEAVDRSATDPLIILRDSSGSIKCTLHRDAWVIFSAYIASECCAFVLWKPTVLTTGGAFKKHYLNITLSNIYAIYSTAVVNDEADNKPMPDGFSKVYEKEFTVIKTETPQQADSDPISGNFNGSSNENDDLLDGLDGSIFLDEIF